MSYIKKDKHKVLPVIPVMGTIRKTNREMTCTERLSSVKKSNEFRK